MRWFRFILLLVVLLFGVYLIVVYYFAEESKSFTVQREVDYPLDKVFPQFNNLQNFARWNHYFADKKELNLTFYKPYSGQGSAMSFSGNRQSNSGELYIRYQNKNSTLKYQLYEGDDENPTQINLKFIPISKDKTRILWFVHTPKLGLLKRSANFFSESDFLEDLDLSLQNLRNVMANKVERDQELSNIKYDSLMVENEKGSLLLGINVSTSNKSDALIKNIVMNHNKVYNFVTMDMGKKDDEVGFPVLISAADTHKEKEVSYFYGIPLSNKTGVNDNNFNFRTINPGQNYVIYYKGHYEDRFKNIQQLLLKAKRDTMRTGELQQIFIKPPSLDKEVIIKFALPVYK